TMLEFYVAYADYTDLMTFTEEIFTRLAQDVLGATTFAYQGMQINLTRPWRRLPWLHAIREVGMQENANPTALLSLLAQYTKAGKKDAKLVAELDETFQKIVEPKLIQPTFITDYPTELSPLARRKDADPSLTDRFELYVAGRKVTVQLPYEIFVGLRYLRAKRRQRTISLNTFVSVAGITLGVAALIGTLGIMTGFKEDLQAKILGTTSHIVVQDRTRENMANYDALVTRVQQVPHVLAATPFVFRQV